MPAIQVTAPRCGQTKRGVTIWHYSWFESRSPGVLWLVQRPAGLIYQSIWPQKNDPLTLGELMKKFQNGLVVRDMLRLKMVRGAKIVLSHVKIHYPELDLSHVHALPINPGDEFDMRPYFAMRNRIPFKSHPPRPYPERPEPYKYPKLPSSRDPTDPSKSSSKPQSILPPISNPYQRLEHHTPQPCHRKPLFRRLPSTPAKFIFSDYPECECEERQGNSDRYSNSGSGKWIRLII
ncbi:hypothetical protein BRADI_2g17435v3 [Brachypodium distachyon]|uniref:Uncharacterized protein n=1 Tax=Brachypodium distachyon TaxID=15368 RepID=A0A2K2D8Z6_BRADI|nr:hypothetical protein BRADI_2g17435v3 [Brachypodium distachyon]